MLGDIWQYEYDDFYNTREPRESHSHESSPETSRKSKFVLDPFYVQLQKGFPIELFPSELLYLILERVDPATLLSCMYVNKRWKSIAINVANADLETGRWKSIVKQTIHKHQNSFKMKSKNLTWSEFFANSIRWWHVQTANIQCIHNYKMKMIRKLNIYKDNIIVVEEHGVTYYDLKTHEIRRQLSIPRCFDFLETDEMVLKYTQHDMPDNSTLFHLDVFGKMDETDFSMMVELAVSIDDKRLYYRIEKNNCFILNHKHVLYSYIWDTEESWHLRTVGRFYGTKCDALAMNVLNSEMFMLLNTGQMMYYDRIRRNFEQGMYIRMPANRQGLRATLVHLFSIVFGVPADCAFRITRYKNKQRGHTFFKFECPNLSCVTEHGELLFLGYNDGKVEIFIPRAPDRRKMFKRRINIADFDEESNPEERAVVSIEVFEDIDKHYLFVATKLCVYQFLIKYPDSEVWLNAPFPELLPLCTRPLLMRYKL